MLPVNTYQLVQVDLGELPVDERREAARWQIRERLDYPPEEAVIDLFEVAPFGGEKRPLTYVVSASSSYLRDQVQALSKSGLTIAAIDIPEFALRNICDLFTEDERGLALLWLEEHTGLLVVVRDGSLYLSRSFNTGMADLIPYADGAYESLTEQLDSIVLEIQRSFDFCESTFQLPMVSRLLIAQTGQEISAIYGYLNEYLTTKVEPLSFSGVLTTPEGLSQVELNGALPGYRRRFAPGAELMRQQINLYQDILLEKPEPLLAKPALLLLTGVFAVLVLLGSYYYHQVKGLEDRLLQMQGSEKQATARIAELAAKFPPPKTDPLLGERISRVERRLAGQKEALKFFHGRTLRVMKKYWCPWKALPVLL